MKQRSRGRNNNGGGKKHMPSRNQTYDSNGPDIRIRGNAHQVLEKYLTMARDCTLQGDRVAAENYYQHAEHYFRVINSQNQANGRPNDRPVPTPADDQMQMSGGYDGEDGEGQDDDGDEGTHEGAHHEGTHQVRTHQVHAHEEAHEDIHTDGQTGRQQQRQPQRQHQPQPQPQHQHEPQPQQEAAPATAEVTEAPPPVVVPPRRRREPRAATPPAEQNEVAEA